MDSIYDFTEKFREQFMDPGKVELKPESNFRNAESWDSLTGMAILVMIKSEYGVDITAESFRELPTVNDVYIYIKTHAQ